AKSALDIDWIDRIIALSENFNITRINVRLDNLNLRCRDDELHFSVLARHLNLSRILHASFDSAFEGVDSLVSSKWHITVKYLPLLRVKTHTRVVIFL